MTREERAKRIRQVEQNVERLTKQGWALEAVEHRDEEGEPFRTVVRLRCDGQSAMAEPL